MKTLTCFIDILVTDQRTSGWQNTLWQVRVYIFWSITRTIIINCGQNITPLTLWMNEQFFNIGVNSVMVFYHLFILKQTTDFLIFIHRCDFYDMVFVVWYLVCLLSFFFYFCINSTIATIEWVAGGGMRKAKFIVVIVRMEWYVV